METHYVTFSSFSEYAINDCLLFISTDEMFKGESITPKLHLLEDHVCRFLREWGFGFRLYGEQGMECLHNTMNQLVKPFKSMGDDLDRVTSIMGEHYARVNPKNRENMEKLEPNKRELRKRKSSEMN